jgi:hypothetical protein
MNHEASRDAQSRQPRRSPSPIAVTAVRASTFVGPGPLNAHPSG